MEFTLLGPMRATVDGHRVALGGPKQRAVLAVLLLHHGEAVSGERIVELVWGDDPPRTALHSVQVYISDLRKALGDDAITTEGSAYRLTVPPEDIDVARFEGLVRRARRAKASGSYEAAVEAFHAALDLWRGEPLDDFTYAEFAQPEIRRLQEMHLESIESVVEAEIEMGKPDDHLADLQRLTAAHPLRESLWRALMLALYHRGRPAEALRAYQSCRRVLGDELGVEPSGELKLLEERILLQDPVLGVAGGATIAGNPYKGLRPFAERDAADFFGRDDLVARLQDAIAAAPLVTVVGPSGSGKSSVVQAGLIPALRAADIDVAVMTPGRRPHGAWDRAVRSLGSTSEQPLVIIDQFEELFTRVDDQAERGRFVETLIEAATGIGPRLVIVVRADFFDRPLQYRQLGELIGAATVPVVTPEPAGLEEAAVGPARRRGIAVEPALLAELVSDVSLQPGALPLFQYALTQLYEGRRSGELTLDEYRRLGGLSHALAGKAESAYEAFTQGQKEAVRQLALRLTTIGGGAHRVRRRVPGRELAALDVDPVDLQHVLECFGDLRLLTFDRNDLGPTVELAHDSLLERWPRLAEWLEKGESDLRVHAALASAMGAWEESGEQPDYLPTGTQLADWLRWADGGAMKLTSGERRFLVAAVDVREAAMAVDAERTAAADKLARQARRRLSALVVTLLAVVVGGAVAAVALTGDPGPRISLLYDGRGDAAFGDLEASGWDRAQRELDFRATEVVPVVDQAEDLRSLLESGSDLVIGGGIAQLSAMTAVAPEYSDTRFALIDSVLDVPDSTSVLFAAEEGSFLAGAAAALTTETGTVGFVGGMPLDLIEAFRAGFEAGVGAVDPDVEILAVYVTDGVDFGKAFARPDLGEERAAMLFEAGADVVYHAAGASGWGVVDAAVALSGPLDRHLWAIGVDTDQYLLADDVQRLHLLTSMVKRVDEAVFRIVEDFLEDRLEPGVIRLGVAEGGVGLAESGGYLAPLAGELAALEAQIVSGSLTVPSIATGPLVPVPREEATVHANLAFGEGVCAYKGPAALGATDVVAVVVQNTEPGQVFMGFVPIVVPGTTIADLPAGAEFAASGTPLAPERAEGAFVSGLTVLEWEASAGEWAVGCVATADGLDRWFPAAVITVGG